MLSAVALEEPGEACPRSGERASRSDPRVDAAMERYVTGDLEAFDELYQLVAGPLHRHLMQVVRNRALADDLLQQTFLKAHLARSSWLPGSHAFPYLLAIARNAALDELRKKSNRNIRLTETGALPDSPGDPAPAGLDAGDADAVRSAVSRLPPRYREAIELTKNQSLSLREASLVAGSTETAMKLRLHRAYKLLRKRLARFAPALGEAT